MRRAPIERASVVVLLPVGDHGEAGVAELYEQTRELLSFRPPPVTALGTRVAFDAVPIWGAERTALEQRIGAELRAIPLR